ncbi:MAG: hypothetical protein ACK6DY_09430 [Acidobacteriota bacterium]
MPVSNIASGGAFRRAYTSATQQAFLEVQELGFPYFGEVFERLQFDNLNIVVREILLGHQRLETERMLVFRSRLGV